MSQLEYRITPADPAAHRFVVELAFTARPGQALGLNLPTWIPGSYLVRDFARHLLAIEARAGDRALPVTPVADSRWEIVPEQADVVVRAVFYARDASVRAAFLDDTRGFFNFTSLALWPDGSTQWPVSVTLERPPAAYAWSLVTTLRPDPADNDGTPIDDDGFGRYVADHYHELIDHPVAMGHAIESVDFTVAGVPHAFVLLGPHDADTERLRSDLSAICARQSAVFASLPARRYLFLAHIVGQGFGGLEHRESSVLEVGRAALPSVADPSPADGKRDGAYETLLGLASHEYFHLWNVKRIRPAAVAASDLSQKAYFRDLWAYEGVTSYYDDLALVRAGVLDESAYLDRLARLATRIERTPGRHRQSLAESSFDAWLKFYRPDENTPNAVISYYGKGAQLALGLDLKLRLDTEDRVSLDTVMQALWQRYGATETPAPEHALAAMAAEVSGLALDDFFSRHVETPADAPWADHLAAFGIRARRMPASDEAALVRGRMGLTREARRGGTITHVLAEGPAERAGLSPGDRVIALDGIEVREQLAGLLARYPAGARLRVHLFRDDRLLTRELELEAEGAPEWQLEIDETADDKTHARRARWLHREPVRDC